MRSLFFLYLLALGVFGGNSKSFTWHYSFNASEHKIQQTNLIASMNTASYISLYIKISEIYQNPQSAKYSCWITSSTPSLINNRIGSIGTLTLESALRMGPCGIPILISPPHDINILLVQEVEIIPNEMNLLLVDSRAIIELEETLISDLPASSYFESDGLYRYRTVKMDPPYENKVLVITLSTPNDWKVSDYINEVILETEDYCNSTYHDYSLDRIDERIPHNSGSSYNFTVPAKDIWYITFVTTLSIAEIKIDFKVVDT